MRDSALQHTEKSSPYRKLQKASSLLVAILLLAACVSTSAFAAPASGGEASPAFEGVVGQDWHEAYIPLFQEVGGIADIAYGAGKLWAVSGDLNRKTPALLTSTDGIHWEQIDLAALGIPDNLTGDARLLGTEEEIIVLIENHYSVKSSPDVLPSRPWVLRGDGERWQVVGDEQFGPWQVNARRSGTYLNYQEIVALAERDGEIVFMPGIGWFKPRLTSGFSLGLGQVMADGTAALIADYGALNMGDPAKEALVVTRMLVHDHAYLAFTNSSKMLKGKLNGAFVLWRSADGRQWTSHTPALPEQKDFTRINDAVIGPGGMVAVGSEAALKPGSKTSSDSWSPVALFSSDGSNWHKNAFGEAKMDGFMVTATASAYYIYEESELIWHSADGTLWNQLPPMTVQKINNSVDWPYLGFLDYTYHTIKVIGLPEGLIALRGSSMDRRGAAIMFSGALPFDYVNLD